MKSFLWIPLCLSLAALGGCYETDAPVLSNGERLPLQGTFQCKWRESDYTVRYTETRGAPLPLIGSPDSYSYRADNGDVFQARKVKNNLYIGQTLPKDSKGGVILMFYEFVPSGFQILEERHPQVGVLAERYRIKLTRNDSRKSSKLSGNATDLWSFASAQIAAYDLDKQTAFNVLDRKSVV